MPPAIPIATYRLQLTADFDFDAAAAIVPYLKALGITHLYASPFMKARKGRTHGYDIVDHTKLNPELGGEAGFERLSAALKAARPRPDPRFRPQPCRRAFRRQSVVARRAGMGPGLAACASFDIDWDILPYRARGRRAAADPRLVLWRGAGKGRDRAALRSPAKAAFRPGISSIACRSRPSATARSCAPSSGKPARTTPTAGQRILELASRYKGLRHPNRKEAPAFKAELTGNRRQRRDHRARARRLSGRRRTGRADARAASSAGTPALPARPLAARLQRHQLSALLRRQYAGGIAGRGCRHLRGHSSPGQEADRGGQAAGPAARSHRRPARSRAIFPAPAPPGPGCAGPRRKPFYMVIEKILGEHEKLLAFPGVHGTTGYEWLNAITQVLVDGNGLEPLDEVWRQISNQPPRLAPVLKDAKRRVLETLLTSEFTVLSRLLARIAGGHYSTPRLFRRQPAAGARTLRPAFSGLSHLSDPGGSDRARPRADSARRSRRRARTGSPPTTAFSISCATR